MRRPVGDRAIDRVMRLMREESRRLRYPVVGSYKADPFQTLISCLLSLRTQDATTDRASRRLFSLARTPAAMLALTPAEIRGAVYPASFYRVKARRIREICRILIAKWGGRVPDSLEGLLELPGVGRKTANLVVTLSFGKPGICVDTHVHRIANRWGYVRTRTPEQTEMALRARLPARWWRVINDYLVAYGQSVCRPLSPWCSRCRIARLCPRVGVARSR